MAWMSALAHLSAKWRLLEGGFFSETDSEMTTSLGIISSGVSIINPMLRASQPTEGTDNGLEVFSSTCLTDLGSWRTGTPLKTDSKS